MQCQWTAISQQQDKGWIAYFNELPQAVAPGETKGEALDNLHQAVTAILNAGFGGMDLVEEDEADTCVA